MINSSVGLPAMRPGVLSDTSASSMDRCADRFTDNLIDRLAYLQGCARNADSNLTLRVRAEQSKVIELHRGQSCRFFSRLWSPQAQILLGKR